jgi:hypothetical protein
MPPVVSGWAAAKTVALVVARFREVTFSPKVQKDLQQF